jgi:uncharacterized RDD family membrane protein YckC
MEYISVGRRAGAIIIDTVLLLPVFFIVIAVTGERVESTDTSVAYEGGAGATWILILLAFGYFILMEKLVGATIGKLAVGVRVVMEDGTPVTWAAAILRNLLRVVDSLFVYLVGAIIVWNSPTRQRLGDKVAKTVVVSKQSVGRAAVPRSATSPDAIPPPPPPPPA